MYSLRNDSLEIFVLDPQLDPERFGTRYCTGGYIFQIIDLRCGELLSGPTFPLSFNTFDGQGIPDAFNLCPLCETHSPSSHALIIGVGECDLLANQVIRFCSWDIQQNRQEIQFHTQHVFKSFLVDLIRTVTLRERMVRSETTLRNLGARPIPIRWFPHPFFPHPETNELCRFNIPVNLPENPAYALSPTGFIRRTNWPWTEGHYLPLDHTAHANLVVLQRHPLLGLISTVCSYIPTYLPIWGNPHTFSWEPFLERTVGSGQTAQWGIDYLF